MFNTPKFWREKNIKSILLLPLSFVYSTISILRERLRRRKAEKLNAITICVGNVVAGGAGKTPTIIALIKLLSNSKELLGSNISVLMRGYGGNEKPLSNEGINNGTIISGIKVNSKIHDYKNVGDESLLIAKTDKADVWVGKDRANLAKEVIKYNFKNHPERNPKCLSDILLFDDGLQSHYCKYDIKILAIDELQGIGNGYVIPSGPLRIPFHKQLESVDVIILIKHTPITSKIIPTNDHLSFLREAVLKKIPIFEASFIAKTKPLHSIKDVFAFAGIGFPEKFKKTLEINGYNVVNFKSFPDHYPYKKSDIEKMMKDNLQLITTTKDYIRIPEDMRKNIISFEVELNIEDSFLKFLLNFIKK